MVKINVAHVEREKVLQISLKKEPNIFFAKNQLRTSFTCSIPAVIKIIACNIHSFRSSVNFLVKFYQSNIRKQQNLTDLKKLI